MSDKGLRCRRDRNRPAIALELVVEHGGRVEDAGFACREHAAIVDVARKARNRLDLYGCAKPVSILPLLPIPPAYRGALLQSLVSGKNKRRPVVDFSHKFVGVRRDDRDGPNPLT